MEKYQRRKLYRIHLKNISEIKNCRKPPSHIAYTSRLFNFDLGVNINRNGSQPTKQRSPSYPNKIVSMNGKSEENFMKNYIRQKQNIRLSFRIVNTCGSISISKYQKDYLEHHKIMNMHRKIKEKRTIMYKISDIMFKGITPDLTEKFYIYDMSKKKMKNTKFKCKKKIPRINRNSAFNEKVIFQEQKIQLSGNEGKQQADTQWRGTGTNFGMKTKNNEQFYATMENFPKFPQDHELLLSGNIFELRKSMIKGYKDQKIKLKIIGRGIGEAMLQQIEMIPIMLRKQIVGSLIVQIC